MIDYDKIKEEVLNIINKGEWIEWQHISKGISHCPVCLVLDNCWFDKQKMPQLPQHPGCHCYETSISPPTENNTKAECDIRKFTEYVFAEKGILNGKKCFI